LLPEIPEQNLGFGYFGFGYSGFGFRVTGLLPSPSSRHITHVKMPRKKIHAASNEHNVSFKTFDVSYVLTNKSGKIVAKYVGGKHKSPKTCVWVPKVLVSNVKGPKTIWVPKNKA
jgi:hypothetical protein